MLAYHNIRRAGAPALGDRSLHLSFDRFREQLDQLGRTHEVVELSRMEAAGSRRPRAAITFDDAYRGAMELGLPELEARALPATVFVAPHFLGGDTFWWDALAGPAGLPDDLRSHCLETLRGENKEIRHWADRRGLGWTESPDDCRAVTEAELARAAARPGVTLGSHTWSHPNLARLDPTTLASELDRPLEWLRARFQSVIPSLSYPYGRWSRAVATAAQAGGYQAALRVDGGWFRPGREDQYALPRFNVPAGLSAEGFRLRAAGLFCR